VGDVEAAVIGGKIYLPGGQLASGEATNILEIYDIGNGQWFAGAPLPVACIAPAVVAFEGRLYVFGGWDGKRYYDMAFEYDPAANQWNELPAMPTARAYAGAAVAGGRIYVIGGRNDSGDLDVNEVFSPAAESQSDAWESAGPMPMKRAGMGLASVADTIHVVGGLSQSQDELPSLFYSPTTNRWTILERSLTQQVANMRMVPMETLIYVLGGQSRSTVSNENRSYQPLYTIAIPLFP
jgi:N-acetylneuraminic acid mutarotase